MVIIDTAIWIEHIRRPIPELGRLLIANEVVHHSMVTVELALGSVGPRLALLAFLCRLPEAIVVSDDTLIGFVEDAKAFGVGIGYVDTHLIAACSAGDHRLWTRDQRLAAQAERLGLGFSPA